MGGIVIVVDGDEAHPQFREQFFDVLARLDILPPEPGQILDHHAVYLAGLYRLQHLPDMGPVKAGSGIAVVVALHDQVQLRVTVDIGVDQVTLVLDAVALDFLVQILLGKPAIGITKKLHEKTS